MTNRKLPSNRPTRRPHRTHLPYALEPFDPATAFEDLRGGLGDVEALAQAANDALEVLPGRQPPEKRRELGRLYTLVTFAARAATEALDRADKAQRRLDAHMAARRSARSTPRRGPR